MPAGEEIFPVPESELDSPYRELQPEYYFTYQLGRDLEMPSCLVFEELEMNVHQLDKLLNPHRIALIGVTINPNSVGGKVLSNLVGGGYKGVVYPVNPTAEAIMGVPCYPDLDSLPRVPDLAIICTGAAQVPDLVEQCGNVGVGGVIIMSAGFREIGEEGKALEQRIRECLKKYDRDARARPQLSGHHCSRP